MQKLGFGFLRLPKGPEGADFDYDLLNRMVDAFLTGGGRYFDTAYTYLDGKSEEALRKALVERHPRDSFEIATKLPGYLVKEPGDCEKMFQIQLERCGVTYFDVYLLHWLNPENYRIAQAFDEFGFLQKLKEQGRAKRIGFSYHGDAALLETILNAHPEVDMVQLQINYLDWEDPAIQAKECHEVAARHGKSMVVMEPVKGGTLANLPEEGEAILRAMAPSESPAAWAIRFASDLAGVETVLSGMNSMEQLLDNQREFSPLSPMEREALRHVSEILNRTIAVPCTGCRYCVSHCPRGIPIPDLFTIYNSYCRHPGDDWKLQPTYEGLTKDRGRAGDCIACGACVRHCPQNIPIPTFLPKVAEAME